MSVFTKQGVYMNSLDTMSKRLQYAGGHPQQSRMIKDKLKSLQKALLYSYQAGVMILQNPDTESDLKTLEFRCLMNPDKITFDTNKMMLSVPFEEECLNADNEKMVAVSGQHEPDLPGQRGDRLCGPAQRDL